MLLSTVTLPPLTAVWRNALVAPLGLWMVTLAPPPTTVRIEPLVVGVDGLDDGDVGVRTVDDVEVVVEVEVVVVELVVGLKLEVDVELDVESDVEVGVVVICVTTVDCTTTVVVSESEEEDTDDEADNAVVVKVLVAVDDGGPVASDSEVGLESDDTLSEVSILPPMACDASAFGHRTCVPFPAMNRPIKLSGV